MKPKAAGSIRPFKVSFEVANEQDIILAERGLLEQDQVRRLTLLGIVNPRATRVTRLALPDKVVNQLGLVSKGKVKVRYANNEMATRDAVKGVYVRLLGRDGVFTAVVEPKRRTALIGAIVLEDLD